MQTARKGHHFISRCIMIMIIVMIAYGAYTLLCDVNKPRPVVVRAGQATLQAEIAETAEQRYKGLSDRSGLTENQAMLFKFEGDDKWEMVMRNMSFPLYIIWLDKDKKVVHIEHEVQPDAEPYEIYKPKVPARYVLEVAAGVAKKSSIVKGSKVEFTTEATQ